MSNGYPSSYRPPAGYNPPPAPGSGNSPPRDSSSGPHRSAYGAQPPPPRAGPYDRSADQGWGSRSGGGGGGRRSASPEFDSRGRRFPGRGGPPGGGAGAGYGGGGGGDRGGYGGPPQPQQQGGGGGYGDRRGFTDPYRQGSTYPGGGGGGGPPSSYGGGGGGGYGGGGPPQSQFGGPPPSYGSGGGGGGGGYGGPPGGGGGGYGGPPGGGGGAGYGGGPPGGGGFQRAGRMTHFPDRDEAVVIKDRVDRERPCRTLFVRNLKFGLQPEDVRRPFADIGDIKTFFDLLDKRAMAFITYYDSRAAMMAKDRMHDFSLMGRRMDVHYSLPRDADLAMDCDREKGQGTLSLMIRNGPPGAPAPSDQEIFQRFSPFGDIKAVFANERDPRMKYIEWFDSRGTVRAYDSVNNTSFGGGTADLRFEWDKIPPASAAAPPPSAQAPYGAPAPAGYGAPPPPQQGGGRFGGAPPAGPGGYGAASPYRAPPPPSGGGYTPYGAPPVGASPYGGGAGGGYGAPHPPAPQGGHSPYPAAAPPHAQQGGGGTPYGGNAYGAPPPPAAAAPPPAHVAPPPSQGPEHGLEQARKMQELLASLAANPNALQTALAAVQQPALQQAPPQQQQQQQAPPSYPAYNPPPVVTAPSAQQQQGDGASPLPPTIGSPSILPPGVASLLSQAGAGPAPTPLDSSAPPSLPPSSPAPIFELPTQTQHAAVTQGRPGPEDPALLHPGPPGAAAEDAGKAVGADGEGVVEAAKGQEAGAGEDQVQALLKALQANQNPQTQ